MSDTEKTTVEAKVEVEPKTKKGIKTSEFWKSVIVQVVAIMIIAYGMNKGSDGIVEFGSILMGLVQGSYNIGRALEKGSAMKLLGAAEKKEKE